MSNLEDFIVQIKESFVSGCLYDYLMQDIEHEAGKIEEFLKFIVDGKDDQNLNENARLKASVLLQKLQLFKEDGTL